MQRYLESRSVRCGTDQIVYNLTVTIDRHTHTDLQTDALRSQNSLLGFDFLSNTDNYNSCKKQIKRVKLKFMNLMN